MHDSTIAFLIGFIGKECPICKIKFNNLKEVISGVFMENGKIVHEHCYEKFEKEEKNDFVDGDRIFIFIN